MQITISSHVLDLDAGGPAPGMRIRLARQDSDGLTALADTETDEDGRAGRWEVDIDQDTVLQVQFDTGAWYAAKEQACFYPQAVVSFQPRQPGHYHIPLLINRHGYSTYRGS